MEHLLYVLWHDYWKPWISEKLDLAAHIILAALITSAIFCGLIWMTTQVQDVLRGLVYVG